MEKEKPKNTKMKISSRNMDIPRGVMNIAVTDTGGTHVPKAVLSPGSTLNSNLTIADTVSDNAGSRVSFGASSNECSDLHEDDVIPQSATQLNNISPSIQQQSRESSPGYPLTSSPGGIQLNTIGGADNLGFVDDEVTPSSPKMAAVVLDAMRAHDAQGASDLASREMEDKITRMVEEEHAKEEEEDVTAADDVPKPEDADSTTETAGTRRWQSSVTTNMNQLTMMFYSDQNENKIPSKINYLILAVRNDSPHLVEKLLERCTAIKIYSALLFSINIGRDHITKIFLEHPKYDTVRQVTKLIKLGSLHKNIQDQSEEELTDDADADDTVFSADVTPLMLAAQRNQFEVVQALLAKGETIEETHSSGCKCTACIQQGTDELRQAKTKLTTFKALASDSYIVLASRDPVFNAFELSQKLQKLAIEEKHFKAEYLQLAGQSSDLSGRLLDRVRDGRELDIMLNEKSGSGLSSYDSLARLKLAIHHREKKFVAHASCQKKLASMWIGNLNPSWVSSPARALLFLLLVCLCYPFAAFLYWINPYNKVGRFLQIPLVKFAAATGSYVVFVCLVIGFGATEKPASSYTLCQHDDPIGGYCMTYMNNVTNPVLNGTTMYVRYHTVGVGTYLLCVWLLGLIWENVKKIYNERYMYFTQNMYNILDFVMLVLYILSFSLRFSAIGLVNNSLDYFSHQDSWINLANNDIDATSRIYWLNADRSSWVAYDLSLLSESLFAIASLMSVSKLTYIFTISEKIGPLLISLAKMIEDMFAFMVVFVFIIGAFVVGFHNLFWYFYITSQERIGKHEEGDDALNSFGSMSEIIKQFFWSIFGLVEMEDNMFFTHDNGYVTSITGHVMFAFYNWMMVIILINMLIAMMSRSYEFIAATEDTEWKFARTKLFLEYIREGSTMPPPFNLVPTWKGVYLLYRKFSDNWCRRCAGRPVVDHRSRDIISGQKNQNITTQGAYPADLTGRGGSSAMNNLSIQQGKRLGYLAEPLGDKDHSETKVPRSNSKEPGADYLEVIGEVKKRFIQQHGKGKGEASFDGVDQLKQDMSSLRQELMTSMYRQDKETIKMTHRVAHIEADMLRSRDLFIRQHQQLREDNEIRMGSLQADMRRLDTLMTDLQTGVTDGLNHMQHHVTSQLRETRVGMEILKDSMFRLCADVSALRGRDSLAHDVLIRQRDGTDVTNRDILTTTARKPDVGATLLGYQDHRSSEAMGDNKGSYGHYGPISVSARRVVKEK